MNPMWYLYMIALELLKGFSLPFYLTNIYNEKY